jgi:hypothetical protein
MSALAAVKSVRSLVESKKGILLNISLGDRPIASKVTLGPRGDIPQSPLVLPFNLPDACAHTCEVIHVLEYLPPAQFFAWWDELWRVMRVDGLVYVRGPYGGDESQGWLSDPTHQTRIVEASFAWLDPRLDFYALHAELGRPTPKPWEPQFIERRPGTQGSISYQCTIKKVAVQGVSAR